MISKQNLLCLIICNFITMVLYAQEPTEQKPPSDTFHLSQAFVPDDRRALIHGDMISFQVFEDEEAAQTLLVNDEGFIDFPYIGHIQATGKTCKYLADELKQKLEKNYYYTATVFIALVKGNPTRGKVYLVGEINEEGAQGIPAGTPFTLSKAILSAGGFTQYAKKDEVLIVRSDTQGKTKETIEVDVEKIFKEGNREFDPILMPEDFIIVPKSRINF